SRKFGDRSIGDRKGSRLGNKWVMWTSVQRPMRIIGVGADDRVTRGIAWVNRQVRVPADDTNNGCAAERPEAPSSRRCHARCAGTAQARDLDRKSTRLNSSH